MYYSIKVTEIPLNDQLFMFKAYLKTILMLLFYLRLGNTIVVGSFFFLLFVHAFCFLDVDCFDFPLDLFVLDLLWFLVVAFLALGDNWNVELLVLTEDVAADPDGWDPKDARIVTCKYEIKKKKLFRFKLSKFPLQFVLKFKPLYSINHSIRNSTD